MPRTEKCFGPASPAELPCQTPPLPTTQERLEKVDFVVSVHDGRAEFIVVVFKDEVV